jgi:hypothetical protein
MMPPIEIDRVSGEQPSHHGAQIPQRCFQEEMKMIGHQTNQINARPVKLVRLRKIFQETLSILVILENDPPFVPADADVVDRARKLHPEQPRHASDRIPDAASLSTECSPIATAVNF